jgi:hypothetical protein
MLKIPFAISGIAISMMVLAPLAASAQIGGGGGTGGVVGGAGGAVGGAIGGVTGGAGDVGVGAQQPDVGRGATTTQGPGNQGAGQATFGNLIAALNNVSAQIQQVQALNNVNAVDVVDVNNVASGNNVQVLNNALNNNNVNIVRLRNVLNNNEVIKRALNNNNIAISDVVAIDVLSGGNIVVYRG